MLDEIISGSQMYAIIASNCHKNSQKKSGSSPHHNVTLEGAAENGEHWTTWDSSNFCNQVWPPHFSRFLAGTPICSETNKRENVTCRRRENLWGDGSEYKVEGAQLAFGRIGTAQFLPSYQVLMDRHSCFCLFLFLSSLLFSAAVSVSVSVSVSDVSFDESEDLLIHQVVSDGDDLLNSEYQFAEFKAKFGKTYATAEEHDHRFNVFKANLRRAKRHQLLDPSAEHGVTQFSDLTPREFRQNYLGLKRLQLPADAQKAPILPTKDLPTDFDWRNHGAVTAVKDQV